MCGINGFNFNNKELLLSMNEATKHRGPDGTGSFFDEEISLGHNLLAIADNIESSLQPVVSENKNYALVFNGEIYNYRKLRAELELKGTTFKTDSDTEVLFAGLMEYGTDFLEKLDGMFAFAFYDKTRAKIILARDAMGMKPLYYYYKNNQLIFSSEFRGLFVHDIPRKLDQEATGIYFTLGYVPMEKTLVADVRKVCPGQYLIYDLKNQTLLKKNHSRDLFVLNKKSENKNESENNPDELLNEAVKEHTMGVRPYGLYLSGGMDSTVILHELSKFHQGQIKTYTTAFETRDAQINEDAILAKKLCADFNIDHHELVINEKDFIAATEIAIYAIEEPRYHISLPAYWLLAKEACRDIVVVLSGNGGDETFLGYTRYLESQNISRRLVRWPKSLVNLWYNINRFRNGRGDLGEYFHLEKALDRWIYFNGINRVKKSLQKQIYKFDFPDLKTFLQGSDALASMGEVSDMENAQGALDRLFWLADEDFIRSDKLTMWHGMEGRFPFVAKKLINYVNSVPSEIKLKGGITKNLLRQTYKNKLPDYITNKKKTGWYAPTTEWMKSEYGEFVKNVLSKDYYPETAELFDLDFVRSEFVEKIENFSLKDMKRFMPIFSFQIWAKQFKIKL